MKKPFTNIVPLIVTYNPDEATLIDSLRALLSQAQTVVIVDNDSRYDIAAIIRHLDQTFHDRIKLIKQHQNGGLGKAFNTGIAFARDLKADFVLLMDQDSIPEPDMLDKLYRAYSDLTNHGIVVGAVAPCYRYPASTQLSQFVRVSRFGFTRIAPCRDTAHPIRTDFLISSGSFISIQTLSQVGGMDESLFIDHIDTEWCFRAQSKGFAMFGVYDAVMQHSLGDKQIRFWCGRWRNIPVHQPFRYYYMFRNSLLLWRRDYMPSAWKRADMLRIFYVFVFFALLSPNRKSNFHMMIDGLKDGFSNRSGKL